METVGIIVNGKVKPINLKRKVRWFDPFAAIEYLGKDITLGRPTTFPDGTVVPSKHIVVKRDVLGLRKLGALDYLKNYHDYQCVYR